MNYCSSDKKGYEEAMKKMTKTMNEQKKKGKMNKIELSGKSAEKIVELIIELLEMNEGDMRILSLDTRRYSLIRIK